MALIAPVDTQFGASFPTAYIKVVGGSWTGTNAIASAAIYASKDARDKNLEPLDKFALSFDLSLTDSENVIAQAYQAIKDQAILPGCVDA